MGFICNTWQYAARDLVCPLSESTVAAVDSVDLQVRVCKEHNFRTQDGHAQNVTTLGHTFWKKFSSKL